MSKEVKRWVVRPSGLDGVMPVNEFYTGRDQQYVLASDYEALLAERDALKGQVETLTGWYANSLDVVNEVTAILPGAHYMDPPDGGDVSIPEQVRRMAKDAERYRWLRDMSLYVGVEAPAVAMADAFASNIQGDLLAGERLDSAIDAALQGEQP